MRIKCTTFAVLTIVSCSRGGATLSDAPGAVPSKTSTSGTSLGNVMVQVAQRFEIAGRAAKANRFELAEFEAGELKELFETDVARAELPKEGPTAHIPAMAKTFLEVNAPDLRSAAATRDPTAFAAAFQRAASACNACHRASAKAFIQVPSEPGKTVPDLDP